MLTDAGAAVAWLRTPEAIRERCNLIFAAAERDRLAHFVYRPERLPELARFVASVIREDYPTLDIPYHSRWRHFAVGGRDRWAELAARLQAAGASREDIARARFDLAVTSVLLDAGAGESWRYREPVSGATFTRSEGLAVASFDLFVSGAFSAIPGEPWRADAAALERFDEPQLAAGFQVSADNPLVGLAGRAALLRRLGVALRAEPALFGDPPRIGNLVGFYARTGRVSAADILAGLLRGLGPIWPGRIDLDGVNLGDVWRHPAIVTSDLTAGLVPFHKLSQWLAYSLVEPLEDSGIAVDGIERLTGLPEYRNGGLFIDGGVLVPKHAAVTAGPHPVESEIIVEWRALTVALLDRIAALIRTDLDRDLALAKILQGGTWSAGRRLARDRRSNGSPPISVVSDGTVF